MNPIVTPNPVLDQILASPAPLSLCWLGNNGWLIRNGGTLIAFDLDLNAESRLAPPAISSEELAPFLDALFITHEHGDHFRIPTISILARQSACTFILPANCVEKARSAGVPESRILTARPRQAFELLGMQIRPTRAFHGHTDQILNRNANLDDCGYLISLAGLTIFQPGDSLLTQDHLALTGVDLLFISPTSHNMHIRHAALLIETLKPRWIIPQHFDTYKVTPDNAYWTVGYPDELRAALPPELRTRFHKLRQGEVFSIQTP